MNTVVISQVLGIFFVIAGISMVINSKGTNVAIEASVENKGILWLWGLLALLMGATIVSLNNEWTSGLPLFVTVLGWIALIKGSFIFIFPGAAAALYRKFSSSGMIIICGIAAIVIGITLLSFIY